jgi:tetratricopeptide (TPR) repeat protein
LYAYADKKNPSIYAIQIASQGDLEKAQKQFQDIADKLDPQKRDYLRIEHVGKYYPLRLGLFNSAKDAREFLQSLESTIPSAIVVKTMFLDKRIEQMYRLQKEAEKEKPLHTPFRKAGDIKPRQDFSPEVSAEKKPEKEKAAVMKKNDSVSRDIPVEEKLYEITSLIYSSNYESALDIIKHEIVQRPHHPELNALFGTVLLRTNRPEEAQKYLKKAAELSPATPGYHNDLGYCYFFLNDYDKAIESFNKTVLLKPDHVDALTGLGIISNRKGDKEASLDYYSKLKELDADSAEKLLKIIKHVK